MARERIWTKPKDATLIALHRSGLPYAVIANEFGISKNAAAGRISTLIHGGILKARHGKWTKMSDRLDWLLPGLAEYDSGR